MTSYTQKPLMLNDLFDAIDKYRSMDCQEHLIEEYEKEVGKCWELAQKLDYLNPELTGAFTGTPSQRIERQLYALGVLK